MGAGWAQDGTILLKTRNVLYPIGDMPSREYKEARICECGYTTIGMRNWSQHKKYCKLKVISDKERITILEKQLADTKEQLLAKDEQINEQRKDLRMLEELLAERFTELQDEVKQVHKRKKARRINRSEPERRKIAERQNWKCAGDTCNLPGKLEAYDLDHIIPLWKNGDDTEDNLQALCPACHRKKTDLERQERVGL